MVVERLAMACHRLQKKFSLVREKFFQEPKAIVNDFLPEPQQTNNGKKENKKKDFLYAGKVFKPCKDEINKK
jgi:hypothetical protein